MGAAVSTTKISFGDAMFALQPGGLAKKEIQPPDSLTVAGIRVLDLMKREENPCRHIDSPVLPHLVKRLVSVVKPEMRDDAEFVRLAKIAERITQTFSDLAGVHDYIGRLAQHAEQKRGVSLDEIEHIVGPQADPLQLEHRLKVTSACCDPENPRAELQRMAKVARDNFVSPEVKDTYLEMIGRIVKLASHRRGPLDNEIVSSFEKALQEKRVATLRALRNMLGTITNIEIQGGVLIEPERIGQYVEKTRAEPTFSDVIFCAYHGALRNEDPRRPRVRMDIFTPLAAEFVSWHEQKVPISYMHVVAGLLDGNTKPAVECLRNIKGKLSECPKDVSMSTVFRTLQELTGARLTIWDAERLLNGLKTVSAETLREFAAFDGLNGKILNHNLRGIDSGRHPEILVGFITAFEQMKAERSCSSSLASFMLAAKVRVEGLRS